MEPLWPVERTCGIKQRCQRAFNRYERDQRVRCRRRTGYRSEYAMLGLGGIVVMSAAAGAVRALLVIHAVMKELRRKTFGADLKGKCMVRCGHEARRHERTRRQCEQQEADTQLAAPSM